MSAPRRVTLGGLFFVGDQQLTLSNSTAVSLNGTMRLSKVLDISVETNHCRYRAGPNPPTLSTGNVLFAGGAYRLEGYNGTSLLRFQRSTGVSKVSITGWRFLGDEAP